MTERACQLVVALWAVTFATQDMDRDTERKYPYVVAFLNNNVRTCTGTLITPSWVLTAAHCQLNLETVSLQYGNMSVAPPQATAVSKLRKLVPHPASRHYSGFSKFKLNDVQLVLVERIPMERYGNLSAIDYRSLTGSVVETADYGKTLDPQKEKQENIARSRLLQLGYGVVAPCDAEPGEEGPYICVAPKCSNTHVEVATSCFGGPLFYQRKVVGVLSSGSPTRYAPISPYMDWIREVILTHDETVFYA